MSESKGEACPASPTAGGEKQARFQATPARRINPPSMLCNPTELSRSSKIIQLPRGGVVVETKAGAIQFGVPPNTIKDTMSLGRETPLIYVVTRHMFDVHTGINVAEVEFPAYFSFFIKKRRVTFIVEDGVEERVRTVFRETLLGPESYDLEQEVGPLFDLSELPDLRKECAALRTFSDMDELMSFVPFERDAETGHSVARVGNGVAIYNLGNLLSVTEDGLEVARVPSQMVLPLSPMTRRLSITAPFTPPQFGVTVLGNSSGFDANHDTTGVLLWIKGRGILVDPPVE